MDPQNNDQQNITDDSTQYYHIISEKRESVHLAANYYICKLTPESLKHVQENMHYDGMFDSEEKAKKKMEVIVLKNHKDYTEMLLRDGLPDKQLVNTITSRNMCAFVPEDMTLYPGVYTMPVHDFIVLKERFPSFDLRLATSDEMDSYHENKTMIITNPNIQLEINKLIDESRLTIPLNVCLLESNTDPETVPYLMKAQSSFEKNIINIINTIKKETKEKSIAIINETFKDQNEGVAEGVAEGLYNVLSEIIKNIKKMKNQNASEEDIVKYVTEFIPFDSNLFNESAMFSEAD